MGVALDRILYGLRLKRRPRFQRSRADVLKSVPVRNSLIEWKKEETGEVSLVIPVDRKRHLRALIRLFDLPAKRVVALDDVGAFVWERCDGKRTFEQIAKELVEEFRLTRREAEASLAEFFRILGRRGMLGFVVPASAVAESKSITETELRIVNPKSEIHNPKSTGGRSSDRASVASRTNAPKRKSRRKGR